MNHRALVIEDEITIALELEHILQDIGYIVVGHAATTIEAHEILESEKVDLVISDINLEGEFEGIDLGHFINKHYPHISIIFLTSYTDSLVLQAISEVQYISYIVKPFKRMDLETACKLNSYTLKKAEDEIYKLNDSYTFTPKEGKLIFQEKKVSLTKYEIILISCMVEFKGNIVGYDVIDRRVWDKESVDDTIRRNLIYRLNKKLPQKLIGSKNGVGYIIL